jgi:hypothetical protein
MVRAILIDCVAQSAGIIDWSLRNVEFAGFEQRFTCLLENLDSRNHVLACSLFGEGIGHINDIAPYCIASTSKYKYVIWQYDNIHDRSVIMDGCRVSRISDGIVWKTAILVKYAHNTAGGRHSVQTTEDFTYADERQLLREGRLCQPASFSQSQIQTILNSIQWGVHGRVCDYPLVCGDWKLDSWFDPNSGGFLNMATSEGVLCSVCKQRVPRLLICQDCRHAFYCSRECQRTDWISGHRAVCAAGASSRAGSGAGSGAG